MNKVILMGRMTRDLELRRTSSDKVVGNFTLAVNRRFNKDEADFVNCVVWEKTAEFIEKYFRKGSLVSVVGRLQASSYEKDGETRYKTEVVVEEAYFTGEKKPDDLPF